MGVGRVVKYLLCALVVVIPDISLGAPGVVINEIFYHAPDDIRDLEWVELHNASAKTIDLSGWSFVKGIRFQFPKGTKIGTGDYLVIAKDPELFAEFYETPSIGGYSGALSNRGEALELANAEGERVDRVRYGSRSPWPVAPDGFSASLERIATSADSGIPENWLSSPMLAEEILPAGTPGARNAAHAANLPPAIEELRAVPEHPVPGQSMTVSATVAPSDQIASVELYYRIVQPGQIGTERVVKMAPKGQGNFAANIPGQASGSLIRYRVRAIDSAGLVRMFPAATALRPARSAFVLQELAPAKIPYAFVINPKREDKEIAEEAWNNSLQNQGRRRFVRPDEGLDLSAAWFELTVNQELSAAVRQKLRDVFTTRLATSAELTKEILAIDQPTAESRQQVAQLVADYQKESHQQVITALPETVSKRFQEWTEKNASADGRSPANFLKNFLSIEKPWLAFCMQFEFSEARVNELRETLQKAVEARSGLLPTVEKAFQGEVDFMELQAAVGEVEQKFKREFSSALTFRENRFVKKWQREQGSPIRPRLGPTRSVPPRGQSAFVFVESHTSTPQVFDFVHVGSRSAGHKVRFHKDRPLQDMTTVNLIFEYKDRFVLAEWLAFELYRRVGNSTCKTDFVRLSFDGRQHGYQLMFEQPNKSFFRRNKVNDDGNLYKLVWYGRSLEGRHEKKTNIDDGHQDLIDIVKLLEETNGDEQWAVIEEHFDVPQMINYFAVNTCLSHWDGFFNNYFAYHDVAGTGKWQLYPWDQDKTWGFYDAIGEGQVFFDMPLTFGMEGDKPPGGGPTSSFGRWWRRGGEFSRPLLANPTFRGKFLLRMQQILSETYTEDVFFPIIDQLADRLRDDVSLRATAINEDAEVALKRLDANVASLKEHLTKRRKFLLEQDELGP